MVGWRLSLCSLVANEVMYDQCAALPGPLTPLTLESVVPFMSTDMRIQVPTCIEVPRTVWTVVWSASAMVLETMAPPSSCGGKVLASS
jgi:hypothetical protein